MTRYVGTLPCGGTGQGSLRPSTLLLRSLQGVGGRVPSSLASEHDHHGDNGMPGSSAGSVMEQDSSTGCGRQEQWGVPPAEDQGIPPVQDQRSLRVAVIGLPNAGKSTLVNQLVQKKVKDY